MFAPISAIFGLLLSSVTLPNGIRLIELRPTKDSVEIIAGYDEPGLTDLASTSAARTLIFDAFATGGNIQLINDHDRSALRLTVPQWALPMFTDLQLSAFFKDPPKASEKVERPDRSPPDFRAQVEEEIRSALLGADSRSEQYGTADAFLAISATIPDTLRDALGAIPRRGSVNRPESESARLPAERTLRFKSDLATGAVIFAVPVPSVYYKQWYLILLLDRILHRAIKVPFQTTLVPSLRPHYYGLEIPIAQGQFPEPAEDNLLQELQRLQLTLDSGYLLSARQEALQFLGNEDIQEWFASRGIPERLEEGIQWVQSVTTDELRAGVRDLLLMNRVIATWAPKPQQTTVAVENLSEGNQGRRPSPGAPQARRPLPEGAAISMAPFPPHNDSAQDVDVPQRLASRVSLVASNVNAVFVSGGTLTKFDHEPDAQTLKSFEKYRADRILVLTPASAIDHAREIWSGFKGNDSGETGVPKGPVSSGDLPAVYVLKTILDLKVIQAGWWPDVELRIDANEGSALQIRADAEQRQRIIEWIRDIAAHPPADKDFSWMREVAIHRFNAVRSDVQALTWERDPQGTIQDIGTIVPKFLQDVAQIYF